MGLVRGQPHILTKISQTSSHEIKENLIGWGGGADLEFFYVNQPVVLNNRTTISFVIVAAQCEHQMGFSMSLFGSDVVFAPIKMNSQHTNLLHIGLQLTLSSLKVH